MIYIFLPTDFSDNDLNAIHGALKYTKKYATAFIC